MWEWGKRGKWRTFSIEHREETEEMATYARTAYAEHEVPDHLRTIIFEEGNGQHAFPPGVKEQAYQWLDKYLK